MLVNPSKYCVYYHKHGDFIFYVGSGRQFRPFECNIRTEVWLAFVERIGGQYDVEIVRWFTRKRDAENFEKKEIARTKAPLNRENRITHPRHNELTSRDILEELCIPLPANLFIK